MRARDRRRKHTIQRIAIEAHRWACRVRDDEGWVYSDLCGACVITAAYTLKRLIEAGIGNARFVRGNGHAYVRVGKLLVDSTGMQFGFPRVWVRDTIPTGDREALDIYRDRGSAATVEGAVNEMRDAGWYMDASRIVTYVGLKQQRRQRRRRKAA